MPRSTEADDDAVVVADDDIRIVRADDDIRIVRGINRIVVDSFLNTGISAL
jgi:hypothetical protein